MYMAESALVWHTFAILVKLSFCGLSLTIILFASSESDAKVVGKIRFYPVDEIFYDGRQSAVSSRNCLFNTRITSVKSLSSMSCKASIVSLAFLSI